MQDDKRGSHTVWDLKYHLVWTSKYFGSPTGHETYLHRPSQLENSVWGRP
jgi:hypothetical protein